MQFYIYQVNPLGEVSFEDPIKDLNSNTTSTLLLLDYATKTKCKKFILASFLSVYGEQKDKERFSEIDKPSPKSFYAVGKNFLAKII